MRAILASVRVAPVCSALTLSHGDHGTASIKVLHYYYYYYVLFLHRVICGNRVRVEQSSGKVRPKPWMRGGRGPPRSRKAFHPEDRCYECGDRGHYAYDCYKYRRGGRRSSHRYVIVSTNSNFFSGSLVTSQVLFVLNTFMDQLQ